MGEFLLSVWRALRYRARQGKGQREDYKSWWDLSALTEAGAYATTYVAENEIDYRSRGWNGDANSFGARQLIELAGLTKSSRVLEIGCGMARVGRELAPHVAEWHGVDISRNMLDRARQRTSHLRNVHLHELPEVSLAMFPDESFDFVYATTVLMHLDKEDLYQYLLESHRVLRPGGIAFFDTWNLLHPETFRLWRENQAKNIGANKTRGRIQFSTAWELRRYLEEGGFDISRFDEDKLLRVLCRRREMNTFYPDDALPPFGYVDVPTNESNLKDQMHIEGWILDVIVSVEVILDGSRTLGHAQLGDASPDVAPLFPRYRDAKACRFHLDVRTGDLPKGHHTLSVVARDRNGQETDLVGNYLGVVFE